MYLDMLTVLACYNTCRALDKTISNLEMQLAAARAAQAGTNYGPTSTELGAKQTVRQKVFLVMGIITAFSSRKRRDSIRATWMPQGLQRFMSSIMLHAPNKICKPCVSDPWSYFSLLGENLRKLEKEKGIIMRFVIGHR